MTIQDPSPVEVYRWPSGHSMRRETGTTGNGNAYEMTWVLRGPDGAFIDYDRYRHDIMPRHGLANIEPCLEAAAAA